MSRTLSPPAQPLHGAGPVESAGRYLDDLDEDDNYGQQYAETMIMIVILIFGIPFRIPHNIPYYIRPLPIDPRYEVRRCAAPKVEGREVRPPEGGRSG